MEAEIGVRNDEHGNPDADYWAEAVALRLTQLGELPQHHALIDPADLHAAEEHAVFLQRILDALSQQLRDEQQALHCATRALECYHERGQDALRNSLSATKSRRNGFVTVVRLPPEVVEKIFLALVAVNPPTEIDLGWISRTTHVCQAWRRIALGYPDLWTSITVPLLGREWTDTVFLRSKNSQLNVNVQLDACHNQDVELVCENLYRTPRLRIQSGTAIDASYFVSQDLESLEIDLGAVHHHWPSPHTIPIIPIADVGTALRELRCTTTFHSEFPWTASVLHGLVSLKVVYVACRSCNRGGADSGRVPTVEAIADALGEMPHLAEIALVFPPPPVRDGTTAPAQPDSTTRGTVRLQRLANMSLQAAMPYAQCLLQLLDLPTQARLRVHIPDGNRSEGPEKIAAFISTLHPFLLCCDEPITRLVLSHCEQPWSFTFNYGSITVSAWRGTRRTYFPPVSLNFGRAEDGVPCTLAAVKAMSSRFLRELVVLDIQWDEDTWRVALSCCPCVEHIETVDSAAKELCAALGSSATSGEAILPSLSVLKLRDVDLSAAYFGRGFGAGYRGDVDVLLPKWLEERTHSGYGLQKLDLRRCGRPGDILEKLHAALPDTEIGHPTGPPGGPFFLQWGMSIENDTVGGNKGRDYSVLRVCAIPPTGSESEAVVLDELEVNDRRDMPSAGEVLEAFDQGWAYTRKLWL